MSSNSEHNDKVFWVDIPCEKTLREDEGPWLNVGKFKNKKEAIEFIRENIGPCDDDGNICLLTEGQA